MQPYPAYKDSGIPWLGEIPVHWGERRAKYFFYEIDDRSETGAEEMLSVSHITGVTPRSQKNVNMFMAESNVGLKKCKPDDVVINTMWAWMAALGVSKYEGIVSPSYAVYRPKRHDDFNYLFLDSLLRTAQYRSEYNCRSTGVNSSRLRLYPDKFLTMPLVCPPMVEQEQIARYLDWQTAKINKFIKAKKKLIALLKEQKQHIINEAVTKGINPNVKLKNSGVEWLGEIPEHWQVFRIAHIAHLTTGFPFPSADFSRDRNDIRLLRGVNVNPRKIRWGSVVYWKRQPSDGLEDFELKISDLVLGMDRPVIGSGIRVSKVTEPDTPSLLLQRVARLRATSKVTTDFLLLLIGSQMFADYMEPIFSGISVPHLSPSQICKFKVALPDVEEQQAIADYIEKETALIDQTIERAEQEIGLIQEYRTRLVSDVVTGKIDVRGIDVPDFEAVSADMVDSEDDEDTLSNDDPDSEVE